MDIFNRAEAEASKVMAKISANIKQIFKARMPHINYVLKNGKTITFGADQQYLTSNPAEIAELQKEVDDGHQHIYRDPNEMEIDVTLQERIREAQQKAALEVLAEVNKEKSQQNQVSAQAGTQGSPSGVTGASAGMSAAQLLGVANTATLGGLAAGSSSTGPVAPASK